jgi:hypothetical protein
MIKNLTTNQLILIALAALLLLISAFSFYLLQNPLAELPFGLLPATSSPTANVLASEQVSVPNTPTPTHHISYTPLAAFFTPSLGTPSELATQVITPGLVTASPAIAPTTPSHPYPIGTQVNTVTTPSGTVSPSPTSRATATKTLSTGEIRVTGRLVKNSTAVPNVVVTFEDDVAPRQSTTNAGGHYSFVTLAPGTNFILTFKQSENPSLSSLTDIASIETIEGTLPNNANPIDFPDLELSINLAGMIFEPLSPVDGAAYSAAAISTANPLQFNWSLYSQGGSYSVELGPNGANQPTWTSAQLASTSYMWPGTMTDGSHVPAGNYWWRVAVTKSLSGYVQVIYTQQFDLTFNP